MRIAVDANEANVAKRVGSGQYAYNLLKEWHKLATPDFELFLKHPPASDLPAERPNWRYRLVRPDFAWLRFSLPIHLLLKNPRHDVYFAPAHYSPPVTRSPLVVTIHDLAYEIYPELFLKEDLHKLKVWTRHSVEKASAIIAVSEATKLDLVKFYFVDPDKITVIHNGYDQDLFHPGVKVNKKVFNKYSLPDSQYILYVGTIQPRKNVTRLVQAFHILKEEGSYTGKLVLAGNPGWMSDETIKSIHDSVYANDIILTGYIDQSDLPSLYKGADAFILPSLMEGFGIPLLESMAVGTPVLAADNSSLPEVVGKSGVLFNPYDPADISTSIEAMLKSRDKYSKLALSQASKFSWKNTAAATLQVLKSAALDNKS